MGAAVESMESYPSVEAQIDYWQKQRDLPSGFIYVIQGDPETPLKVGYAVDPVKRLATLQTGSYQDLRVLAVFPGDLEAEHACHRRLKPALVRGEWFMGEVADEFVKGFIRHAELALELHRNHKIFTPLRKTKRKLSGRGMRGGAYKSPLGGRWRLSDGGKNVEVITFAEPNPVDKEEQSTVQRRAIESGRTVNDQIRFEQVQRSINEEASRAAQLNPAPNTRPARAVT